MIELEARFDLRSLQAVIAELRVFPEKVERKMLFKAMRAGGVVIRNLARGKVKKVSGKLYRSVRVSVKKTGIWVRARVAAGRAVKKDDPYWAHFVEEGTDPHEIRPAGAKSLFFAGLQRKVVKHPGARAQPFMAPALAQGAQDAIDAVAATLRREIQVEYGVAEYGSWSL